MENNKNPNIRFKGFTDPWEQRKLGELLSFLKDGTHGTHADVDDGPLLLSAKNIKNGGIYWDETDRRISYGEYEKIHSNFSLESGDVLLTIVGSIGETAILKDSEGITFQRSVAFLRPNNKITPDFLYSEIQTPTFQKELDSRKSTSAQPGIYLGDLAEIPLIFSTKIDEQKKIGEYFSNLDNLITLHQRKYNKLLNVKKSMLEKMFPKNGSNIPEIRFKGFTDPWEQRKAKNLFVSTADKGHPELPVLSATQDRGMIRRDENSINIYHDKKNEEGYKRVLPGQFVIHLRSFQGGFAHSAIEGITSPAYTVFGFSEPEKHNPNYWKYVFTSKEFIRRLETVTYGIRDGRSISYDEFLTMDFVYPTQDEQTKIANYLDTLDNLITLHQRELEKLQNIKKSMLEKMFV